MFPVYEFMVSLQLITDLRDAVYLGTVKNPIVDLILQLCKSAEPGLDLDKAHGMRSCM